MESKGQIAQHRQPNYLGIFVSLVVLTAIEIGVTYTPLPRIPVLVPLAIAKAALVVLFYMHLRFDRRVFGVIFLIGVLMGISLILAMLSLFGPPLLDMPQ
jgi:cytochrome c oxidase subunit IV